MEKGSPFPSFPPSLPPFPPPSLTIIHTRQPIIAHRLLYMRHTFLTRLGVPKFTIRINPNDYQLRPTQGREMHGLQYRTLRMNHLATKTRPTRPRAKSVGATRHKVSPTAKEKGHMQVIEGESFANMWEIRRKGKKVVLGKTTLRVGNIRERWKAPITHCKESFPIVHNYRD